MIRLRNSLGLFLSLLWCGGAGLASEVPVAVSPGGLVEDSCPTFSWAAATGARSHELVVYRLDESGEESALLFRETLPGAASSWTPSLGRCFERGSRYAWSVRGVSEESAGEWSPPSLFEVAPGLAAADFEQALSVVREYLAEQESREPTGAPETSVRRGAQGGGDVEAASGGPAGAAPVSDSAVLPVGEIDCHAGRYENNGDGTVTDCRTGLVWLEDGSCDSLGPNGNGTGTWQEALDAAGALASGTCGLTDGSVAGDWRQATKTEWMGMIASALRQGFTDPTLTDAQGTSKWTTDGDAFSGVQAAAYWSATEWTGPSDAWQVNLFNGVVEHSGKVADLRIWPVRAGQ